MLRAPISMPDEHGRPYRTVRGESPGQGEPQSVRHFHREADPERPDGDLFRGCVRAVCWRELPDNLHVDRGPIPRFESLASAHLAARPQPFVHLDPRVAAELRRQAGQLDAARARLAEQDAGEKPQAVPLPVTAATEGWTCPEHGNATLVTLTSRKGGCIVPARPVWSSRAPSMWRKLRCRSQAWLPGPRARHCPPSRIAPSRRTVSTPAAYLASCWPSPFLARRSG